jgi:meiotically up-regulated gene 157 (Mug157) protein
MRMAKSVLIDSYANAFNFDDSKPGDHADDRRNPEMTNSVFEGKYELDSLAAFLKLSRSVFN